MRLPALHTCLSCMMIAILWLPLGAQEQQRKVTPVKPTTNKVLTPPKGTDEKIIDQYLTGDTASARAQERKDSLARIYPHYPLLTQLAVGLNFGDALLMAFGQKHMSFDVNVTLNMWNRLQPVVAVGLGRAKVTPDDMNFTYNSKLSPYFKVGANYNFLFKNEPRYNLYAGVRLGYSTFKYDITDVHFNNGYWGENDLSYDLRGLKSSALWGEFLVGLKVGIAGNWALGWEAKYHGLFNYKKSDNGKPWYIPGYGVRTGKWGFGLSLYYTIPLSSDRWPIIEKKEKK